jgi:hypothetical protein
MVGRDSLINDCGLSRTIAKATVEKLSETRRAATVLTTTAAEPAVAARVQQRAYPLSVSGDDVSVVVCQEHFGISKCRLTPRSCLGANNHLIAKAISSDWHKLTAL